MKITKSQLAQIIKEELENAFMDAIYERDCSAEDHTALAIATEALGSALMDSGVAETAAQLWRTTETALRNGDYHSK